MPEHLFPDCDPLRVAAGLADRDGTVLLHTQRDWHGTGKSWLLMDPVWALRREGNEILAEGDVPPALTTGDDAAERRAA